MRGLFRQDLYYRLNVVEIKIPPLRERSDDIALLCEDILNKQLQSVGLFFKIVTEKAMLALNLYDWPGNVRELRNVLERAANISSSNFVDMQHLPESIRNKLISEEHISVNKQLRENVAEAEIKAIISAIKMSNGSRTKAAMMLGIHRTAIYKKLARYGIDVKSIV
ncbi:MAG: helix-turn-helix domain-containing protein [Sedimentibacter sp.]|uniref:helix-turn-helix domain-containing protein n=1 Tax=Sedimentibacter sp. TaxID=1960295 RepID=UPI002981006A|nr:helix-turn-helix domain-containing protein [Sedimentibacter sp.]MDW5300173.1 helix-turn-helix domain-containing protein [Sedimentibacter sp.]